VLAGKEKYNARRLADLRIAGLWGGEAIKRNSIQAEAKTMRPIIFKPR